MRKLIKVLIAKAYMPTGKGEACYRLATANTPSRSRRTLRCCDDISSAQWSSLGPLERTTSMLVMLGRAETIRNGFPRGNQNPIEVPLEGMLERIQGG